MEAQASRTLYNLRNHSFNVEFAARYGIVEAIIIRRLQFLVTTAQVQNHKGKKYDGRFWAHIWREKYADIYPYFTLQQIDSAFHHLHREGLIEISSLNYEPRETDFWVTLAIQE